MQEADGRPRGATSTPVGQAAETAGRDRPGPDRRALLRGFAAAGVVGAAGLTLAACGGGDDPSGTAASPSESSPAETPATSAPASPSESPTSAPPSSPEAEVEGLVKTSEVPEGGGTILEDDKLVVTQPAAGQFKAFSAVCTHQSCLVGSVSDGMINCPCHGSQYKIADGSVVRGPATRGLSELPVTVQGDSVVRA